ncbi:hypothetical protein BDR05DRAFT_1001019 [Suillus weaverae]|nr:hypothetical protein BDR05DRAFT_1001019 [Suillus weaverae]
MSSSVTSTPTGIRYSSSSSSSVAISAYPFGFLLVSVVFLFIIVACCFSRWRPGALRGTSWDTTELDGRGGRRRKLVPPVLWDTWLSRPPASTEEVLGAGQFEWLSIQPVYVSLIHAYRSQSACQFAVAVSESEVPADPSTVAWHLPDNSQSSSPLPLPTRRRFALPLAHPFNFHMWPRRRSRTHNGSVLSEKPTEDATEKCPEAVKIAVMISMPSFAFRCWNPGGDPSSHSTGLDDALRDYQIGVAQVPWTHGEINH